MKTRQLAYIGIFAALTAVCSQISITLPFTTVPFTLSLLAVFLCGAILSPLEAFAAQGVYLLIGGIGIPVFAQFSGGPGVLFGMTGGYLIAYLFMAPLIAIAAKKFKRFLFPSLLVGMLLSLALCYLLGTAWFVLVTQSTWIAALSSCVFPFAVFDCVKIVIAASLALAIRKALTKAKLYEAA
ncbi:MAG: biotin transporter BioY [Oscillospiraceae bacterium]|nr:biotin transporter BioY [Oscillospiraceae bacterium]